MNKNIVVFVICCILCVVTMFAYNFKSFRLFVTDLEKKTISTTRKVERLLSSKVVNVFKLCEQICDRKWKTQKLASTGLIALTVAQSFCKNITLYGFYPYERDSSGVMVLHHYYEPNRTSFHTDVHNFDEEYKLLGRLHDNHVLRRVISPCKEQMKSCVDPEIAVLVYKDTPPQNMTFGQTFQAFAPRSKGRNTSEESLMEKWKHKRKFCSIQDLNPRFHTINKHGSCAIVGNSGILLGSNCGEDIDGHDFVLRANLAQLNGYNDDVGNKTSVMMINVETVRKLHSILKRSPNKSVSVKIEKEKILRYFYSLQGAIIWYPKATRGDMAKYLQEIATVLIKENISLQFAYSITSAAGASIRKWETQKLASTGLIALTVAQSFCKNVTLYGFYPYERDSSGVPVLHHYYEPNITSFHTDVHNFDEEYKLLGRLHDNHVLRRVISSCKVRDTAQVHLNLSLNGTRIETATQLNQLQTETLLANQSQRRVEKLPQDQIQTVTRPRNQSHIEMNRGQPL